MLASPYYRRNNLTIYHGDCRQLLRQIPPVDLIITDPAYKCISGGNGLGRRRPVGILSKNDGKIFKHNDITTADYASLFFAVLRNPAHCYVMMNNLNLEAALRDFREVGFGFHGLLPWDKGTAIPNRWYMKDCEHVLFFRKGSAFPINNPSSKAILRYPSVKPANRIHETEKPIGLMLKMILNSSQPGQIVLDPFMGSGSTLEACWRSGRWGVGIEIDEAKCKSAAWRLEGLFTGEKHYMEGVQLSLVGSG